MKKPFSFQLLRFLCWLQIVVGLCLIATAIGTLFFKASGGFWFGFQDQLARTTSAGSLAAFNERHAGEMTGSLFVTLIPTVLILNFANKGRHTALVITAIVWLLLMASRGLSPLFPLLYLGLSYLPNFKKYMTSLKTNQTSNPT